MPPASITLNHVQMPARNPEELAKWYGQTFDLQVQGRRVYGPDRAFLIVFVAGEPVQRAPGLHIGFHVPSMAVLGEWSARLGVAIVSGPSEYSLVPTTDPEGNGVELYCLSDA